jgi:hypothetical protein
MNICIDYATAADRLGTSLAAKRANAVAYLRYRRKYIADEGCKWRPTPARATDIERTFASYRAETRVRRAA